ncbi:hypothetical protein FACS189425_10070 [Clostridia bacterium]|nr:hypothetical protein FACS189425_10070 [Clostridia bacterium]
MFQHIARDASPAKSGRIQSITVRLVVSNCSGTVRFADLFLQGGSVATGWVGNICETKWTLEG